MSGSNALAAAKRRRGGTQDNRGPPPPGSSQFNKNQPQQSQQSQQSQQPGPPVNPLQLVMMNHQRLNSLQAELPKAIDTLGDNFNNLSSNCDYLHDQFSILEKEVASLKLNNSNTSSNTSSNASSTLDLEKVNKLELDLAETHKVVAKTQSFSMDSSLQFMKMKDDYTSFSSSVNKRLDELEKMYSNMQKQLEEFDSYRDNIYKTMDDDRKSFKLYMSQMLQSNNHVSTTDEQTDTNDMVDNTEDVEEVNDVSEVQEDQNVEEVEEDAEQ